jgi:tRNA dimethylallyltransferase
MYEAIETAYNEKGIDWLQEEVRKTDETFFNEGEIENPARLMRALTFKQSTGQSILEFRTNTIKKRNFTTIKYAIDIDRELLYQRINTRVDGMLDAGLMNEVKALLPYRNLNSLNTVGYTELFNYIDGVWSLAQSIDKIKQHTRNYAKRQITWFKHQGNYRWLKAEDIAKDAITIR